MRFILVSIQIAMAITISSCQSYSENGFMSDFASLVKCPANGCAVQTPNANEMTVIYSGNRPILSPVSEQTVQVGGDCYSSTYPGNRISIYVLSPAGSALPVSVSALNGPVLQCVKGRYNLAVDVTTLTTPGIYKIRLQLIAKDVAGVEYTSPTAVTEIPINRF